MGKQKRELPLRETASGTVRCWSDGTHDCAVKDVHEDGQLRSSTTSSTWQGLMPTSYSWSISSRRARRKVLQQLTEELRAEYMEGKAAAAVGTRWAAKQHSSSSSSRHRHRHRGSAGPEELQTEPNVGHLKCHKPVCNCARRAEVIWLWPVIGMDLFLY